MQFIENHVFNSHHLVADLPLQIWVLLLSSHSLDTSLPPVTAEHIFLDHICQACCFHTDPCAQNHCNVIQSHFVQNPREFLRHLIDLALDCNATVPQLVAFCQALGFREHEIKRSGNTCILSEYLTNCHDGRAWSVNPAKHIQHLHYMKINELLILNRIHGLPVTRNETQQLKNSLDLKSSLMVHFLFQPCKVIFDPIHPGDAHCCTIPPHVKAHAEIWSSTIIDVIQLKMSQKITTDVLQMLQIDYSDADSLTGLHCILLKFGSDLIQPCISKCLSMLNHWHEQIALNWPQ